MNDEGELKATIQAVIDANPQAVEDYHNGKKKAIGALVGQTMKATTVSYTHLDVYKRQPDILYNTNSIKAIGNSLNLFNNCCKRRLCYNHN